MAGEEVEVHGSGRTDAGVHAKGQVANFHVDAKICPDGETAKEYLNRYLPEDIRLSEADPAPERFHSRLSASSKTYGYYVETGDKKNVFERKYVYGFGKKLDLEAMRRAAGFLIGEHDFKSFCANRRMKKSTVRRIDEIKIVEHGTKIELLHTGKRLSLQHGADPDGNAPGDRQRNAETGGNEGDPGGKEPGHGGENCSAGRLIPSSRGL